MKNAGSMIVSAGALSLLSRNTTANNGVLSAAASLKRGPNEPRVKLYEDLLQKWCDGLVGLQITGVNAKELHGGIMCPACKLIHGRCGDAVYPLMYMADKTGRQRYLDAAIRVTAWMDNMSAPDGAWINDVDVPWKGITVFGIIALAEAVRWHGHILDGKLKQQWLDRLKRAADYLHRNFTIDFVANINYPVTASYAMVLVGSILDEPAYTAHGKKLAHDCLFYFTEQNKLLFGEGKPYDKRSSKGFLPVDLGYNVEESLPSLVLYALMANDEDALNVTTKSLESHLEFMLPDGAWDNSWGTRSFKWTYWGSRTSDGCQPAYLLLADRNGAFAEASYMNTKLLEACTHEGLLYGGPHYFKHELKPCVHHTFCHAKAMATVLDHPRAKANMTITGVLPRQVAQSVREFPEIQTLLVSYGPWRSTVTGYDWIYGYDGIQNWHPTGGAISMLWHDKLGPILAGSLAEYVRQEPRNMQLHTDSFTMALTPRLEFKLNGTTFSNIYDLTAKVSWLQKQDEIVAAVDAKLVDKENRIPADGDLPCVIKYRFTNDFVEFFAQLKQKCSPAATVSFVLPVISDNSEHVETKADGTFAVNKPNGRLILSANQPLKIIDCGLSRVFNLVPGFEAVPFKIDWDVKNHTDLRVKMTTL